MGQEESQKVWMTKPPIYAAWTVRDREGKTLAVCMTAARRASLPTKMWSASSAFYLIVPPDRPLCNVLYHNIQIEGDPCSLSALPLLSRHHRLSRQQAMFPRLFSIESRLVGRSSDQW